VFLGVTGGSDAHILRDVFQGECEEGLCVPANVIAQARDDALLDQAKVVVALELIRVGTRDRFDLGGSLQQVR
jgi:hypothetical protein